MLSKGRVAVISTGYAEGAGRVSKAIEEALSSPLLDYNDVYHSRKVLVNVAYSQPDAPLMMSEQNEVTDFMSKFQDMSWSKFGLAPDCKELGKNVKVTILVSGVGGSDTTETEELIAVQRKYNDDVVESLYRTYYGATRKNGRSNYYFYVFTDDSLDNDTVISKVAEVPTYMRKAETLNRIKDLEIKNK